MRKRSHRSSTEIMRRRSDRDAAADRSALPIEMWLMSCRVLKRGMEYAMMNSVVEDYMPKDTVIALERQETGRRSYEQRRSVCYLK